MKKQLIATMLMVLLLGASVAQAAAQPSFDGSLTLSVQAGADGKSVTAVISAETAEPVFGVGFTLVYDKDLLEPQEKPKLSAPWAATLASTSIAEPGRAMVALATANGITAKGSTVATVTFRVKTEQPAQAVFALEQVELVGQKELLRNISVSDPVALAVRGGGQTENENVKRPISTISDRLARAIILQVGNDTALTKGTVQRIDFENKDVAPYLAASGHTMVPLRFLAEAVEANVQWDSATKTITLRRGGDIVIMGLNRTEYTVNGETHIMEAPPVADPKQGRTMVPVRAICQALGLTVTWDQTDALICLTEPQDSWTLAGDIEQQAMPTVRRLLSPLLRNFISAGGGQTNEKSK